MKYFLMYCWQEKKRTKKNGQINPGNTTVSFIFLKDKIISMHEYVYKCAMVI